ncbi:hypothetical protein AVEN_113555-1 [Araneus ventricosus]|uniref:Uncharacterized protein n=1 Tax=Araneus ventricosus TaxID=182803 RepID=A0A4Y2CKB7_ARAVE|nr:hypothetical protein AVEN_224899-1 [Araneus ventricosus]GBM04813.1 hypothetical protein AVEN_268932-1 [Araneus ventricosus]GBM04820.1 hypothetical protein AVEN_23781-1 [Araneus ventricosus]GBM04859.1 hypothetical protein AVEN_113555-1 [Araneus ventricosus]
MRSKKMIIVWFPSETNKHERVKRQLVAWWQNLHLKLRGYHVGDLIPSKILHVPMLGVNEIRRVKRLSANLAWKFREGMAPQLSSSDQCSELRGLNSISFMLHQKQDF